MGERHGAEEARAKAYSAVLAQVAKWAAMQTNDVRVALSLVDDPGDDDPYALAWTVGDGTTGTHFAYASFDGELPGEGRAYSVAMSLYDSEASAELGREILRQAERRAQWNEDEGAA